MKSGVYDYYERFERYRRILRKLIQYAEVSRCEGIKSAAVLVTVWRARNT
ncbi:MAG: hypothetical protein QXM00_09755 [Candidatus Bathyarchaeia archaeon]